ncbi:hypothetical protein NIES3787_41610 [Microcystis aeruginosa NIES-3787]|uniref:Uncharacterized protein n=1 Tax=Microcystis aeruginosa NIES-3787 TaxID=2517782 RepID=A0A6H9GRR1_MICAE|nr:hypothetical protein NIES3787_41610 [Microcystis aeruginosa NIES-3787]
MFPTFLYKTEVDGLLVAQRRQSTAHGEGAALRLGADLGGDRSLWRCVWQIVVPHHAGDFFNQVFFNLQIKPIGRGLHRHHTFALRHWQAQTLQSIRALRLGERHANDFGSTRHTQRHRRGLGYIGLLVIHRATGGGRCAANIDDELRNALNVFHRQAGVHTPLETVPCFGRKVKPARAPGD